jgi:Domain of unknown function (DUF4440)
MVTAAMKAGIRAGLAVLALCATGALAQETARGGRLYEELAAMDRVLFDAAFVACDEATFRSLFTDDAEFYHDRDGARYGEDVRRLRSCPRDEGVKRTLVEGSLEVYPIAEFGAVQLGRHVFTKAGEEGATLARFVHLWKQVDGEWRLARVLSFDHHPVEDRD